MEPRSTLLRIGEAATDLLGSDSPANRKVVRRLIERRVVAVVRCGERGDPLIVRSSLDAWVQAGLDSFVGELDRTVRAMTARERREQSRRERAAAAT